VKGRLVLRERRTTPTRVKPTRLPRWSSPAWRATAPWFSALASAPAAFRVRVWQITSGSRRPLAGRPRRARANVAYAPRAGPRCRSLDHLIRPRQQRGRDRQPHRLGGLEVDDQLELRGLLDG